MMSGMPLETVEPSINFGIINSITRLYLVGYFYWSVRNYHYWLRNNPEERGFQLLYYVI